jgi:hypothetical protein
MPKTITMTEEAARSAGFEVAMFGSSSMYDLDLLVKADTDLDDAFDAFCVDTGELLSVNGWLFLWEGDL